MVPLAFALPVLAQSPGGGGPEPGSPTAVPIDGGATLLLAAGLGLGLKRLRRRGTPPTGD
ncbi:MAG: hypothetical protein H7Z21_19170 [Hymenobacter sp.]|nr:hypothetical protein [Hymenobacter sp.]